MSRRCEWLWCWVCVVTGTMASAAVVEAPVAVNAGGKVAFTAKPTVAKDGDAFRSAFAVSAPTDVEVAVLDAKGDVVRHLAAGLLGEAAPAPFARNALNQELLWDGRNDAGRPAGGGPFSVRVRIGSRPRLDRIAGWDGQTVSGSIVGLAVGPGGELFVMDTSGYGHTNLRVFGPDGKYRRTVIPYPANTPKERMAPVGIVEIDGECVPMVFSGQSANTLPLVAGMKTQNMAYSPKGHLLLASAVGTMAEHGLPRHLLAVHPEGGAPAGLGFVGPEIRKPIGFLSGAGEAGVRYFDHLATSPDGEWIYFVPCNLSDKKPRHALFRLKWTDKELGASFLGTDGEAGNDEKHLRDPQGVAVDKDGRLYVCDRGNNRVARFAADGAFLGAFAVNAPEQIAVHPKTGEIYVLSRPRPVQRETVQSALRKFTAWETEAPVETAQLEGRPISLMALDPSASAPRLWIVSSLAWSREGIIPVTDEGKSFAVGEPINRFEGLRTPMFIAADPARGRVIIREQYLGNKGLYSLDLATGKMARLGSETGAPVVAADAVVGPDGNIYTMDGYNKNSLSRYTPEGKPLPFSATNSHTVQTGPYRGYGPDMGMRGHCVDVRGNIYLIRTSNYGDPDPFGGRVTAIAPDGTVKNKALIDGLGYGDCGLGVDAAGNLYVGANVKPKEQPFPKAFVGKVSVEPFAWWRKGTRERPWHFTFVNMYLFYWGSVWKFGPEGGAFYGHPYERETKQPIPDVFFAEKAPADAAAYASAYLGRTVKVSGALWRYAGMGPIPSSSDGPRPDPGCVCMPSHLAVDGYGRVFAPNVFRFSVEMLDANGNQLHRVGRYGNADSPRAAGPEGGAAGVHFAWPANVSVAGGKVYVADPGACRVTVVTFDWSAEGRTALP